jgi:hypothetical protein
VPNAAVPLLAGLLVLACVPAARALVMAPPPPVPERVARADCIVVGKVVALEEQEVMAFPHADAPEKVLHRVAVLKVAEALKGGAGRRTLRVGFPAEARRAGLGVRPAGPRFGTALKVGQEGLFYLRRHDREAFLTAPMYYDVVPAQHPSFGQEVELARVAVKLGNDPAEGLESGDRRERFYAAALLIQRYRTFRGGSGRTEPIGARQSRQILTALAEADWKQPGPITPWTLLMQLGLRREDGWTFPAAGKGAEALHGAARAWLREHAGTYRIRRIVPADPEPPGPR